MYAKVWREARALALTTEQAASRLAGVPYDLRHAALSLWLNSGMDPTDVAERAGDSVEVLFRWYAKCLDGRRERNNRLISQALRVVVAEAD
jgi:integrase